MPQASHLPKRFPQAIAPGQVLRHRPPLPGHPQEALRRAARQTFLARPASHLQPQMLPTRPILRRRADLKVLRLRSGSCLRIPAAAYRRQFPALPRCAVARTACMPNRLSMGTRTGSSARYWTARCGNGLYLMCLSTSIAIRSATVPKRRNACITSLDWRNWYLTSQRSRRSIQ